MSKLDIENYRAFFRALTGSTPYKYQEELAAILLSGQSVIVRAPTGAGKTWATLAPFLYTRFVLRGVATSVDRVIYALPLRSLASNLHSTTIAALEKGFARSESRIVRDGRGRRYGTQDDLHIALQMGGQQDDPFFEADVVFTTIDQLLSSYLFAPISVPQRVGNIGAGALIGSLLIFDEVHLLDSNRSLATTIEMLDRLNALSQFVLMSATLPDSVVEWLRVKLKAESRSLSSQEVLALPSHSNKSRRCMWVPRPLNAEDIVRSHRERTIAIVNSVGRAQSLFRDVRHRIKNENLSPAVLLLHSRFFRRDRERWESQLGDFFGPHAPRTNAILISTQAVEAGIDISADLLLTELAPLNSLIQRAGRVARYPHRSIGDLVVFDLPRNDKGHPSLGPYKDQSEVVNATRRVLARSDKPGILDYSKELAWLNEIHGLSDVSALSHLESLHMHRTQVLRAMDGLDESACSRLVRDVSSVSVLISDNPESISFERRRWPELLSIERMTLFQLRGALVDVQNSGWVLKIPDEVEANPSGGLRIKWKTCTNPAHISWLVAIHPAYARYSDELGLELDQASDEIPTTRYTQPPPLPRYSYEREEFVTHARRVVEQGRQIVATYPSMMRALHSYYANTPICTLSDLVCYLHDAGKLQIEWQEKALRWQQCCDARDGTCQTDEPLAHTSYDPMRDRGNPLLPHFPPHATCGAFAALPYFVAHFSDEIALVLCTAIARHHGVHTSDLREFELIPGARAVLEGFLPDGAPHPFTVSLKGSRVDTERFSEGYLLRFSENEGCWPLFVSLVRILRLADQGSLEKHS